MLYLKISCYNMACAFQQNIYIVHGNYRNLQQHVVHPVSLPARKRDGPSFTLQARGIRGEKEAPRFWQAACCAWKRNMIRLIIRMSALQKHHAFKVLLDLVRQFSDDSTLKVSIDYVEDD